MKKSAFFLALMLERLSFGSRQILLPTHGHVTTELRSTMLPSFGRDQLLQPLKI